MKPGVLTFLICACYLPTAGAQIKPAPETFVRSRSGQFLVYGNPTPSSLSRALSRSVVTNWVRLQPTLLAVSCERIKEAMLRELSASDQWRGKFYLRLHPIRSPDETIQVTSARMGKDWMYNVQLPDAVGPNRLIRTMIRLLLVEWADRGGPAQPAVPEWLSEGLAEQVLADSTLELVLRPPTARLNAPPVGSVEWKRRKTAALAQAHEYLRVHRALTLDELFSPTGAQLAEAEIQTFRSSAQLFVYQLLKLRDGPACLNAMLDSLGAQPDAQTALLAAFSAQFKNRLDLEKWWELQTTHFTGRELSQRWFGTEAVAKLEELLVVSIQTRADTNSPAVRETMTLQGAIGSRGQSWQFESLRFKAQQLQALEARVSWEVAPLVDDYRRTIEAFLRRVERARIVPTGRQPATGEINSITKNTIRKLDDLDAQRSTLAAKLAAENNIGVVMRP